MVGHQVFHWHQREQKKLLSYQKTEVKLQLQIRRLSISHQNMQIEERCLKALFSLKAHSQDWDNFWQQKTWLDKKDKVNFKIYGVITGNQIITILSNISRNQTIKFGQLIEYNMINIFVAKLYTKFGAESSPRLFSKKSKLNISLDQQSETFVFIVYPSWEQLKWIYIKVLTNCF